jgi:hypothetical protein
VSYLELFLKQDLAGMMLDLEKVQAAAAGQKLRPAPPNAA